MIQILALYLYFEGAKNINVPLVLIWGFKGLWGFLTGVWHLDLDLDIDNVLLDIHNPNFAACLEFECAKTICAPNVLI